MRRIYLIDSGINIIDSTDGYSKTGDFGDDDGHGTSMAYIIRSVSKCEIVNIKIPREPTALDIVDSLSAIVEMRPGIVSANWVVQCHHEIDAALNQLLDLGFDIVSPVGNTTGDFSQLLPASNPRVIAVGSINKSGIIASHCNFSKTKKIDLFANGTNISAINHTGKQITITGTSAASALVAGLLSRTFFNARSYQKVSRHLAHIKCAYARQLDYPQSNLT